MECAVCAGALSWCSAQAPSAHFYGLFRETASLICFKTCNKTVGLQFGLVERTNNEQCPPYQRKQWCTCAALALLTSCAAWTITRRRYMTLFDWSSQRTDRRAGTIPFPRERGSSRTPPCKLGYPEVYPQPSKKISLGTCWSHLAHKFFFCSIGLPH